MPAPISVSIKDSSSSRPDINHPKCSAIKQLVDPVDLEWYDYPLLRLTVRPLIASPPYSASLSLRLSRSSRPSGDLVPCIWVDSCSCLRILSQIFGSSRGCGTLEKSHSTFTGISLPCWSSWTSRSASLLDVKADREENAGVLNWIPAGLEL